MTVDAKVYEFAQQWLQAGGWTHSEDVMRLAMLVQDLANDFVTDLEVQYDAHQL